MAKAKPRTEMEQSVERGLAFLTAQGYPLGTAWVAHRWHDGPVSAVIDALGAFQNEDGGFAGLEVDIKAPDSNPFAARLAMHVLATLDGPIDGPLRRNLERWLIEHQDEDGDWHFAPAIYEHELAPWFAGWTFPSLNPACCLAGLAARLGIGNATMQARVRALFDARASLDEARTGEFYNILPYVEYLGGVDHPERDAYLDALAANIAATAENGGYADAGHFFEHALGGGSDLLRRLPADLINLQRTRLVAEQAEDGGWPTPYDPAWRPWATASSLVMLADLERPA